MSGDGAARLFVALELPDAVVEALVAWRNPLLHDAGEALRAVAPDALHVTLCFLGSRPESAVEPLAALVEACAGPVAGLALGEPLWLPRRHPRVLAIALDDRHGELTVLQGRVVERLVQDGWYEPEGRPYLPHVTVARVRGEARPPHDMALPAPPDLVFDGAALTLFRSRLHPSGARYEPLSRHALA